MDIMLNYDTYISVGAFLLSLCLCLFCFIYSRPASCRHVIAMSSVEKDLNTSVTFGF